MVPVPHSKGSTRALARKEEAFCWAYIETGNVTDVYRRCYSAAKMKPETVNREGKALLDKIATRSPNCGRRLLMPSR